MARRLLVAVLMTFALIYVSACGDNDTATIPATESSVDSPSTTSAPTAPDESASEEPARSEACERPSQSVVDAIETGLTVDGQGGLRSAYAVRSSDFDEVWMLAAQIEGPGFNGEVGVWAVNNIDEPKTIYAADALAAEFSDWGTGPIQPTDNGIDEAIACVEGG